MTTTVSLTLVSPTLGTVEDTYTLSDDDAARLLTAYTVKFTPRRGPPQTLTPVDVVHQIAETLWGQLAAETQRFFVETAAQTAAAQVAPVAATVNSQVTPPEVTVNSQVTPPTP